MQTKIKFPSGLDAQLKFLFLTVGLLLNFAAFAQKQVGSEVMEWTINNTARKAMVYIPSSAKTKPTPIIFAFHGHGGTMGNMYKTKGFEKLWQEAIVVCPQGLNTPGQLTDKEGKKAGWQIEGSEQDNKDLQFFDAIYKTLTANYQIDKKKVFATGHSNGGSFTYLLWATRADLFTAFAPTASAATKLAAFKFIPKSAFILMGEADPLVKPQWQKATHQAVLKLNKCEINNVQKLDNYRTLYLSNNGNPVILYVHPGGHEYPQEASVGLIEFFKSIK